MTANLASSCPPHIPAAVESFTGELGPQALGRALLILVPTMQFVAIGCYAVAAQRYRRNIIAES